MKKRIQYSDVPLGRTEAVVDFLPKPQELVLRESNVRVTLNLSQASVGYFRELGRKSHLPYQKLIRRLLDEYARKAA